MRAVRWPSLKTSWNARVARTTAGAELTEQFRTRQLSRRAMTLRELLALWPAWSVDRPGSFEAFAAAATTLTRFAAATSAEQAGEYYEAFRLAEQVDGRPTTRIAQPPDEDRVRIALRATGLQGTVKALRSGRSMDEAREVGFTRISGAVGRLAIDGANRTLLGSVNSDRQARGWRRITSSDPCHFCAMLAGRGGVYSKSTVGFDAHNYCACTSEPAYSSSLSDAPERNQEFRELWNRSQAEPTPDGLSSDALNKFRRLYEAA